MSNDQETFNLRGYTVRIIQDEYAESPDKWGNEDLFLITTSNRYFEVQRPGFDLEDLKQHRKEYHILPLYAYIHSGVALSLGRGQYPFNDQWDSGQIGFVFVKKGAGFRNIRKAAKSLVDEWNMYLSGDVWGYVIETPDGDHVDSRWGCWGLEYVKDDARNAVPSDPTISNEEEDAYEARLG